MNTSSIGRSRVKKFFFRLLIGFGLFFIFRLGYGYWDDTPPYRGDDLSLASAPSGLKRNYASAKIVKEPAAPNNFEPAPGLAQSQKYERVATVRSQSERFGDDEKAIKDKIRDFKGIIQYEKNEGNEGSRSMFLQVGVAPVLFDSFYLAMQQYAVVLFRESTKTDMTSEFLQLNAKRLSLEKTQASMLELKKRNASIADLMELENTLLNLEKELQELGVNLGAYDEENEFCTVRITLVEKQPEAGIGLLQRVVDAVEWALCYYCLFLFGLVLALAAAWLITLLFERLGKL